MVVRLHREQYEVTVNRSPLDPPVEELREQATVPGTVDRCFEEPSHLAERRGEERLAVRLQRWKYCEISYSDFVFNVIQMCPLITRS